MGKRQLSITKKKANQKSNPKIMSTNVDHLQQEWRLNSETSRGLKGYLEPLTHLCTVLNTANDNTNNNNNNNSNNNNNGLISLYLWYGSLPDIKGRNKR